MLAAATAGCGVDFRPTIAGVDPPNGATAVAVDVQPTLQLADEVTVSLRTGDRKLVLFDITDGIHATVVGAVETEGSRLTYRPKDTLLPDHDYELVLEKSAIGGEKLLDVDGSEWPQEPMRWPFRTRLSTRALPQVRAAYLERNANPRLHVRFTQPMNQVVTTDVFNLVDQLDNPVPFSRAVWTDPASARIDLQQPLDPAGLYTLVISKEAEAETGVPFDGDEDRNPGEPDDDFSIQFTGSQQIVRSRLVDPPAP